MFKYKTFLYALKPDENQKKRLSNLLDARDAIYNQLSFTVNSLYLNNASADYIRYYISNFSIAPWLCKRAAEDIRATVSSQFDKLYSGEIASIHNKSPHQKRREIIIGEDQIIIYNSYIQLAGIGCVEAVFHRPLAENSKILTVKLIEDQHGKVYYISFLLSVYYTVSIAHVDSSKVLGLDYSQNGLYVDSNGFSAGYPGFMLQGRDKLIALRKTASSFSPGSSRWLKFTRRADKLEQHMLNQRKDWQFKQAAKLAKENDAVCLETLDFNSMKKSNPALGAKINDNNWNSFKAKLSSNLETQGKPLVQISQYYPSSQICSVCGHRFGKLPLSQRMVACPNCGTVIDRDFNAARNIRNEGIRLLNIA